MATKPKPNPFIKAQKEFKTKKTLNEAAFVTGQFKKALAKKVVKKK